MRQARSLPGGDAVCYKCHVDKQGPFVFEHVPVKTEGCSSCHTPHGLTQSAAPKVSVTNMLCLAMPHLSTQGPAGPAHNQSAKYQACTMLSRTRFMVPTSAMSFSSEEETIHRQKDSICDLCS